MRPGQKVFAVPGPDWGVGVVQPAAGAAFVCNCTFNDPNGTSLDAYSWTDPADVRPGANQWVEQAGDWDIQGGQAHIAVVPGARNAATLDCGAANGTAQIAMTIAAGFSTMERGLIYRFGAFWGTYWVAGIQQNPGLWGIFEYAFGVPTARATLAFAPVPGQTYIIQVTLGGNNMSATIDGGNQVNWVSATGAANTAFGVQDRDNSTFDNLQIIP